ncbi:Inner centromere protein-related protein pic1 [Fusarium oxysporum f. sp. albedinis]|nr:Inner centromere protein-related protein pic1 [Fusarium oxysporum f. sp. albedinis]
MKFQRRCQMRVHNQLSIYRCIAEGLHDPLKSSRQQKVKIWCLIRHPRKNKPSSVPEKARSGLEWKLRIKRKFSSCKTGVVGCNENFASQTNRQKQTSITTNTSASRSSGSVQNQNSCSRKTVVVQSRALCSCEEVGRGGLLLLRRFEAWRKKIKSRIERRY